MPTPPQHNAGPVPPVITPPEPDDKPSDHKARPWAFALLLIGVVCMGMGQTVVFVVLPPIAREIGLADIQVGFVFMISAVFWVLLGPRWGRISDMRGRRPIILIGIAGFIISMFLFAGSIQMGLNGTLSGIGLYIVILLARSIYGIIGSAQPSAAQAYIADRTTPQTRAKGLAGFAAAFGIGAMFGPAFAGVTLSFGPIAPLYGVAFLATIAWLAIFFCLPEHNPPKDRKKPPALKYTDPRLKPLLIYGLVGGAIGAIPIQLLGFYLIDVLDLTNDAALPKLSLALSASAFANLFAQLVLVGRFSMSPSTLMRYGAIILIAAHGIFALGINFPLSVLAAALSGLGWGMVYPGFTAAASLAVSADEQGATAGLTNAASASGFIIAPALGFALYAIDPRAPFIVSTFFAIFLALYAKRFIETKLRENAT